MISLLFEKSYFLMSMIGRPHWSQGTHCKPGSFRKVRQTVYFAQQLRPRGPNKRPSDDKNTNVSTYKLIKLFLCILRIWCNNCPQITAIVLQICCAINAAPEVMARQCIQRKCHKVIRSCCQRWRPISCWSPQVIYRQTRRNSAWRYQALKARPQDFQCNSQTD